MSNKVVDYIKSLKEDERESCSNKNLFDLEGQLDVTLPDDFKYLNRLHRYDFFEFFEFYNLDNIGETSIIFETKSLRKALNLPKEYLVLSEDDVSVLLLKTISSTKSQVIWCDEPDFFNLCEGKPFEYKVTTFPSFTDFYAFLIDEEEKIGEEE